MIRRIDDIESHTLEQVRHFLRVQASSRTPTPESVKAWRLFYDRCDTLIRRFSKTYVVNTTDLEDCTQEVWVQLIDRLKTFNYSPNRGAFSSWLYGFVRNVTISYFRHRRLQKKHEWASGQVQVRDSRPSDPAYQAEQNDRSGEIDRMLFLIRRNVSRPNYRLLHMRWIEQRSVNDVARTLNLSNKQVWYREHRARKKLREVLCETEE